MRTPQQPTDKPEPWAADEHLDELDEEYVEEATARSTTLGISLLVTVALLVGIVFIPAPYVVRSPGPTEDTLGEEGGVPLIEVSGAQTYPASGELRLTTVSVSGGPGYPADALQVLGGWIDPKRSVYPVEAIFPEDQTAEEVEEQNTADMVSSQENATVAALTEVGYTVPATMTVVDAIPGTGADGVLEPEDVLVSFEGTELETYQELIEGIEGTEAGTEVVLGVERDGESIDVTVPTTDVDGRTILGVYLDPVFDMPVDVSIQIDDIGGPSAGTMFALGIIDVLTPEDEAGGKVIAGTGTMSVDGLVGPIGGIQQKLYGAQRDGATWFLAPETNCDEVVGNVPDGLQVTAVGTLEQALDAVTAIGSGTTEVLPTCADALEDLQS
ncbi:PDZ domain-containing protein [Paraoerskovia marina]|uniref:endopeptidase La n=1 Tax=Paraoerskovia marina TaxID=545619 RepID=A0A1H1UWC5_9CELL|nr:S16 family serine protease [Paraoerskovia marina]SDS76416.1 PDZ domain-containing protein [Paraoerskovia marina]